MMDKITIGIQGDIGSTNERACYFFIKKHNWQNFEIKYLISTENVLKALNENKINYGTFALKSSKSGFVQETQKVIKKYKYKQIDKELFQLDHALLQNSKIDKTKIVKIYSHPHALKEHEPFLRKEFKNIELKNEIDTAIAAQKLQNKKYNANSLVIAPLSCAKIYNLQTYLSELPTNKGYLTEILLVENPKRNDSSYCKR